MKISIDFFYKTIDGKSFKMMNDNKFFDSIDLSVGEMREIDKMLSEPLFEVLTRDKYKNASKVITYSLTSKDSKNWSVNIVSSETDRFQNKEELAKHGVLWIFSSLEDRLSMSISLYGDKEEVKLPTLKKCIRFKALFDSN